MNWQSVIQENSWAATVAEIAVILAIGWGCYWALTLLMRVVARSAENSDPTTVSAHTQRVVTLVGLTRSVGIVLIVVIVLFMALAAIGINIGPLLAGAGVVGLAISFGAQSLVKDILSGLFILFENQFAVGDVIRIGTLSGRVESMTLRIVVMRDLHGTVHVVPNGEITSVSNLTRSFSRAVVEIGISLREDPDRVIEVMRDVGVTMWKDPAWSTFITEEPNVLGIDSFSESGMNIRMLATTLPLKQWEVARELRRRLKHRFDAEDIQIALAHRRLLIEGFPKELEAETGATESTSSSGPPPPAGERVQ